MICMPGLPALSQFGSRSRGGQAVHHLADRGVSRPLSAVDDQIAAEGDKVVARSALGRRLLPGLGRPVIRLRSTCHLRALMTLRESRPFCSTPRIIVTHGEWESTSF